MTIRKAEEKDIEGIKSLLLQVAAVHHRGRPDLFKSNSRKYTDEEIKGIIRDEGKPILVAVDENEYLMGYAFCVLQQHIDDNILTDIKTLYIDDLCVDEDVRGRHVGKRLYNAVIEFAREEGCYNVTLNVWSCNESAMRFYEKCGLKPQKIGMETIL
ncbi:MAG: GNAT family N-acetyltransferase [Clostridiales bacterium]|nr:GNAT family N-acetyltransferase [Clostridiales bacterium]